MVTRRTHVLRDLDQLRCLVSPMRQRMVAALGELGEASVGEVAAHLGEPPEKLYYHLKKLVETGLFVEVGRRPATRRPEAVYRLVEPGLIVDPKTRDGDYLEVLGEVYGAALREAGRNLERALEREVDQPERGPRGPGVLVMRARLSRRHRALVRKKLLELAELMDELDDPAHAPFGLTAVITPVPDTRGDGPAR